MSSYSEKFKDPRWQKKRLRILERDKFVCQSCLDSKSTLHVHHKYYIYERDPWEYPDNILVTLCKDCHIIEKEEKGIEIDLIRILYQKGFLTNDLRRIAEGFWGFELEHMPEVVSAALKAFLLNKNNHKKIVEDYFKKLNKNSIKKNV